MIIKDNVFIGGNYYYSGGYKGEYKSNIWDGNICYLEIGDFIFHDYRDTPNAIILKKGEGSNDIKSLILQYQHRTGDITTRFIIKSHKRIVKLAENYEKKYLKTHKY